jgi:integrase
MTITSRKDHIKSRRGSRYELTADKFLSDSEQLKLQSLLSDPSSPHRLLFKLLLETGARVSELLLLEAHEVDHNMKSISITGLKDSRDRVIPLKPETYAALLSVMPDQGPIFRLNKRTLQHYWTTFYQPKIGTDKVLHSLRHTFAVNLYKSCGNIRIVQQALGHVSIINTMVYSTYCDSVEDIRKAMGL